MKDFQLWLNFSFFTYTLAHFVQSANQISTNAIVKVSVECFDNPLILFLDSTVEPTHHSRNLLQTTQNFNLEVLEHLQKNWSLLTGLRTYKKPKDENIHFRLGVKYAEQIIILIDKGTIINSTELKTTVLLWQLHVVWSSRAKILIVVNAEEELGINLAQIIFTELWKQCKTVHISLFANHGTNGTFYSWKAYSESCEIDAFISGYYINETSWNFNLFPQRKFSNLNNCKVIAIAAPLVPFVFPPIGNNDFYEGIEVRLFKTLAEVLNFSYGFKPLPFGENARMTVVDGKPAGVIGALFRAEADLSMSGSRLTYQRSYYVDHIDSYYGDNFAWIGPLAKRIPRWKGVFLVFSVKIWICFITTFLASFLFLAFLYKNILVGSSKPKRGISTAFIAIWSLSMNLGVTSNQLTSSNVTRCFLLIYLFYVLTINALYTSALYKVMTKGLHQESVETPMEAAKEDMMASIFPSMVDDLQQIEPKYYKFITKNNLVNWTEDYVSCLHRAARYFDCYTLFTELGATFQINMKLTASSGKQFTRVFRERYTSFEPVFYIMRNHPLAPTFRKSLKTLVESGWVLNQIRSIMAAAMRNRSFATEVADIQDLEETMELSMEQVLGAFVPAAIVLMSAVIVFILEIFNNTQLKISHQTEIKA